MGWWPFWKRRSKWCNMESTDADIDHNKITGLFLRFPTPTAQNINASASMAVTGISNPSRSRWNGSSILVNTASMNPMRWWAIVGADAAVPLLVTTKVMTMSSLLETSNSQKFNMGLMCPLPGNGTVTTWQNMDLPALSESIRLRRVR